MGLCVCQVSHVPVFFVPSRITFPDSFRFFFFKAIRHCRICQLRSSKRFWDCGKHRKLYKNISSYFICRVPLVVTFFPPSLFEILEPPPRPFSSFESGAPVLSTIPRRRDANSLLFLAPEGEPRGANSPPSFVPFALISRLLVPFLVSHYPALSLYCDVVIEARLVMLPCVLQKNSEEKLQMRSGKSFSVCSLPASPFVSPSSPTWRCRLKPPLSLMVI